MAFETSTLVNGEWTTRTLDVDTVLRHYDQKDKEATTTFMEFEKAPTIGILTQTVIRSPLVHWILPVKLRDVDTQHVAFIGVRINSPFLVTFAVRNFLVRLQHVAHSL